MNQARRSAVLINRLQVNIVLGLYPKLERMEDHANLSPAALSRQVGFFVPHALCKTRRDCDHRDLARCAIETDSDLETVQYWTVLQILTLLGFIGGQNLRAKTERPAPAQVRCD